MSVDRWLGWTWHRTDRNCWHLVRAVWLDLTGQDVGDRTPEPDTALNRARAFRDHAFRRVADATDPSIVLMASRQGAHVGVHLRGRVLHLSAAGAAFERPASLARRYEIKGYYVP